MTRLDVNHARCEALFASGLQQSDAVTADSVAEAITRTIRKFGIAGCACQMAQEFGDHPEAARDRMRLVRQLLSEVPASPAMGRTALSGQRPVSSAPAVAAAAIGGAQRAA